MQFKFTNLRAGQYLALSNSVQEGKANHDLEVILFQVKQLENENERLESVFKTMVEKNSRLKIESAIKSNLPVENHNDSEKRQIEFLKASLVAISEENEALQLMYNNQQQMIESVSSKRATHMPGASDDIKFLEEENQILQASVDEVEQENRKLRMQIESSGDNAELEKKIKKLKSENSKFKKEKKRLLNAAQMLSGVEMTDELEQLAKCRGVSSNLRKKIEEKYDTILRDFKN